jgi:transcriptional regulator with XRE-family HTH domain
MKVGNKIHKIRELKNITAKDMADRLDMTLSGYQRIERDEVSINMERLLEISGIFEMKPEEVMTFDEKFIFNNYDNSIGIGINQGTLNQFPQEVKQLYEDKIKLQAEQIKMQQEMIDMLKEKLKDLGGK